MNHFRPGSLFPSWMSALLIALACVSLADPGGDMPTIVEPPAPDERVENHDAGRGELEDCRGELGRARRELGTTRVILERTREAHGREVEAMAARLDEVGKELGSLRAELEAKSAHGLSLQERVAELEQRESALAEQLNMADEERTTLHLEGVASRARLAEMTRDLNAARSDLKEARIRYAEEGLIRAEKALREHIRDPDNTTLIWSLNDVGLLHLAEGRLDEAEALFQRALILLGQQLPDNRIAAGTLLQHLADTAWRKNNLARSAALYQQAATSFAEALGELHPRYAAALNGQAGVLHALGEVSKAEKLYGEALAIYEHQRPSIPVDVATPAHNLGLLYLDEGRFDEAESMLKKAVHAMKDDRRQHPDRALIMTRSMIRFCQQTGDIEMAALYQAKANELILSAMTP